MITFLRRKGLGKQTCEGIASKMKLEANVYKYEEKKEIPENDYFIRWGSTYSVPRGKPSIVLNTAKSIHYLANKKDFRLKNLNKEIFPATWNSFYDFLLDGKYDFNGIKAKLKDAYIVRPSFHSRGKDLYFIEKNSSLNELAMACGLLEKSADYYISKFIEKKAEYRVLISNGRCVAMTQKIPNDIDSIAWNRAQDNEVETINWDNWNLSVIKIAIKSLEGTGICFAGVDVVVDVNDKCYVLEANTAPSCSTYRQECMAKVFDWIIKNRLYNSSINVKYSKDNWKDFIHPAISSKAIIGD